MLMMRRTVAKLNAQPATVSVTQPGASTPVMVTFDGWALQMLASQSIADPSAIATLPLAVFAADRAFTQSVRDAIGAEITLRRARGENVAQLESELQQLNADTQMSFNLQYLQLQSQMQHENRSYTAISNVMRTKHDTARNSISNVR